MSSGAGGGPQRGEGPIRILLVDDSKSVRAVLRRFFSWTDDIEVVGEAADGAEAVRLAVGLQPEIILMDLLMPGVDGYSAIEEIMRRRPVPILVLSAKATRNQVQTAFEAFRRGAVEVLPKPEDTESWRHLATTLPDVVRQVARHGGGAVRRPGAPRPEAAEVRDAGTRDAETRAAEARAAETRAAETRAAETRARRRAEAATTAEAPREGEPGEELPRRPLRWLAIGASTGGPGALCDLLAALPSPMPLSVLIVQHISPGFELGLVDWLSSELPFDVKIARAGEVPRPGAVRLAPPDAHLRLQAGGSLALDQETPPWRGHRPSADELFFSCAECCPEQVAAVLLTGMGSDGVQGMVQLQRLGSLTLVQDEATSIVYGMPRVAWERGAARFSLPPAQIARVVARSWRVAAGEAAGERR